mmetsp:Transcript_57196/g.66880  ORF Transcript_57196/g.66880 Transcript_57196/m.66880 type:complete len:352 (+) Transcript_57196:59-1114(+)
MMHLKKIVFVAALTAQSSHAQVCEYDGFKDSWASKDKACYSNGYKPFPLNLGGMCSVDTSLGGRTCLGKSVDTCNNMVSGGTINNACYDDCTWFHLKCCCSPLYPTFAPTTAPIKKTKVPTGRPTNKPSMPAALKNTPTAKPTNKPSISKKPATVKPTRVPTNAPTISSVPSPEPSLSFVPSILSDAPSLAPFGATSGIPSISQIPTSKPTTADPTLNPSSRCPWDKFTGYKTDCKNYNKIVGGDYCYFSAEKTRNWDNSGKFQGDKNPFKLCTIKSISMCDLQDFWQYGSDCTSKCTNFHSICCCPGETAKPTNTPKPSISRKPTAKPSISAKPTISKKPIGTPTQKPWY